MKKEMHVIQKNDTWELTTLPQIKEIGVKWVYKIKRTTDGELIGIRRGL